MSNAITFASQMLDPRGRCNRMALLIWAGVILAVQLVLAGILMTAQVDANNVVVKLLNLAFLWLAFAATSKRLHDIGHSAAWIIAAFAVWIAACVALGVAAMLTFGPAAIEEGTTAYWALFVLFSAPVLFALIWLHAKLGDAGDNRYGPAPSGSGLSMPAVSTASAASQPA
jgi:uncharacterized membrane protein YhaH (DUF805 family)